MITAKLFASLDYVFELVAAIGLLLVWLAYLLMTIQINDLVRDYPEEARKVMAIPTHVRGIFILGDVLFVATSMTMLLRLGDKVPESMKLRWTSLAIGMTGSIHLPILMRAWVFRQFDAVEAPPSDQPVLIQDLKANTELLGSAAATAISSALCFAITLASLWAVDFFPSLRYSDTLRRVSKVFIVAAVVCGELFFISSLVEYSRSQSCVSGIVLLVLSLGLGIGGYVPARYYSIFQDELEEEIPFFAR